MNNSYLSEIFDFAKNILDIPSPSGYTDNVINYIDEQIKTLGFPTSRTKKGNLLIEVKGKTNKTLGLSGHVDTLGAMVRSITSDGDLKFTTIGGPIWPTLDGE
ncbi:MAG TPA: aminopeptidase, partial [Bacillota bacterium]|nr:aminopeptidase [Bacillota bacterium]